jgi:hypothetical protein
MTRWTQLAGLGVWLLWAEQGTFMTCDAAGSCGGLFTPFQDKADLWHIRGWYDTHEACEAERQEHYTGIAAINAEYKAKADAQGHFQMLLATFICAPVGVNPWQMPGG